MTDPAFTSVSAVAAAMNAVRNYILVTLAYWAFTLTDGALRMLVLLYFMNMAYGFFSEARSRALITGLFGSYVPKELVDEMAQNPGDYSMRGESREMTCGFLYSCAGYYDYDANRVDAGFGRRTS